MKKLKKALSIIISAVMIFAVVPQAVFADESYTVTFDDSIIDVWYPDDNGKPVYLESNSAPANVSLSAAYLGDLEKGDTLKWTIVDDDGNDIECNESGNEDPDIPSREIGLKYKLTSNVSISVEVIKAEEPAVESYPLTYDEEMLGADLVSEFSSGNYNVEPDENGNVPEGTAATVYILETVEIPENATVTWTVKGLTKITGDDTALKDGAYYREIENQTDGIVDSIVFYMPGNAVEIEVQISVPVTLTVENCGAYWTSPTEDYDWIYPFDPTGTVPAGSTVYAWYYGKDDDGNDIYTHIGDKTEWTFTDENGNTVDVAYETSSTNSDLNYGDISFTMPDKSITVKCEYTPAELDDILIDLGEKEFELEKAADGKGIVEIDDMADYIAFLNTFMIADENADENDELSPLLKLGSTMMFAADGAAASIIYTDEDGDPVSFDIPNAGVFGELYWEPTRIADLQPLSLSLQSEGETIPDVFAEIIRTPLLKKAFSIEPDVSGLELGAEEYSSLYDVGKTVKYSYEDYDGTEVTGESFHNYRLFPLYPEKDIEEMFLFDETADAAEYDYPIYPYFSKVSFTPADDIEDTLELDLYKNETVDIYGEDAVRAAIFSLATALSFDGYKTDANGNYVFDETQLENDFFKLDTENMKIYLNLDYDTEEAEPVSTMAEGEDTEEITYDISIDLGGSVEIISSFIEDINAYDEAMDAYYDGEGDKPTDMPSIPQTYTNLVLTFAKEDTCSVQDEKVVLEFPAKSDFNMDLINQGIDAIAEATEMPDEIKEQIKTIIAQELSGGSEDMNLQADEPVGVYDALAGISYKTVEITLNAAPYKVDTEGCTAAVDGKEITEAQPETEIAFELSEDLEPEEGDEIAWTLYTVDEEGNETEAEGLEVSEDGKSATLIMPESDIKVVAEIVSYYNVTAVNCTAYETADGNETALEDGKAAADTELVFKYEDELADNEEIAWTAVDADENDVEFEASDDGLSISLTMPASDITVTAEVKALFNVEAVDCEASVKNGDAHEPLKDNKAAEGDELSFECDGGATDWEVVTIDADGQETEFTDFTVSENIQILELTMPASDIKVTAILEEEILYSVTAENCAAYAEVDGEEAAIEDKIAADTIVTAKYENELEEGAKITWTVTDADGNDVEFKEAEDGLSITITMPESDITVKAEVKGPEEPETVKVTFVYDDNKTEDKVEEIEKGTAVNEPEEPSKDGYNFDGWFAPDAEDKFDFSTTIEEDITLTAKWSEEEPVTEAVKVTFVYDDNKTEDKVEEIEKGTAVKEPAKPTKTGYTFKGWFLDDAKYDFTKPVDKDITLKAQWTKRGGGGGSDTTEKLYKLSFETNGGEKINPVSKTKGTEINPADYTPVKEGSEFESWYMDSSFLEKAEKFIIEKDVTLYAKWKEDSKESENPENPDKLPFDDVKENDWFYQDVKEMYEKGLMSGMGDGKFAPYLSTERAMIVAILYRMEGSPAVTGTSEYDDVKEGEWYTNAIIWATQNDIAAGYPDGSFKPDQIVSRQELARFIYQYAKFKGAGFTGAWYFPLTFDDADEVGSWADESVHWCVMNGLMTGVGDNLLAPRETATRAQLAAMLNRLSKLDLTPVPVEFPVDETEEETPGAPETEAPESESAQG